MEDDEDSLSASDLSSSGDDFICVEEEDDEEVEDPRSDEDGADRSNSEAFTSVISKDRKSKNVDALVR